jgi:hypothetical protein
MILRAYFATLGRFALLLACMAFLTCLGLLVVGGFLSTWPLHRQSPRSAKLKGTVSGLEVVIPAAFRTFRDLAADRGQAPSTDVD